MDLFTLELIMLIIIVCINTILISHSMRIAKLEDKLKLHDLETKLLDIMIKQDLLDLEEEKQNKEV